MPSSVLHLASTFGNKNYCNSSCYFMPLPLPLFPWLCLLLPVISVVPLLISHPFPLSKMRVQLWAVTAVVEYEIVGLFFLKYEGIVYVLQLLAVCFISKLSYGRIIKKAKYSNKLKKKKSPPDILGVMPAALEFLFYIFYVVLFLS